MKKLKMLLMSKNKIRDIYSYYIGNLRYYLYYSKNFKWLIRSHIIEQIDLRIEEWMDRECLNNGECKICGCITPALQMANKSCDKPCYPPMMNKTQWDFFKKYEWMSTNKGVWFVESDEYATITFKSYKDVPRQNS